MIYIIDSTHNTYKTNDILFSTNNALKSGVQRVRRNHKGETGLHIAAIKGDLNRVKQIIAENKYPIDCPDFAGIKLFSTLIESILMLCLYCI